MFLKHKLAAAIIALLGATGLVFSTTPGAQADYSNATSHYWTTKIESVKVTEAGDVIRMCDSGANSYDPYIHVAFWSLKSHAWEFRYQYRAYNSTRGDCWTFRASRGGSYNLPEGRTIRVMMINSQGYSVTHKFSNDH